MVKIAGLVNFGLANSASPTINFTANARGLKPCHEAVRPPVQNLRDASFVGHEICPSHFRRHAVVNATLAAAWFVGCG